jgi:hypothetical protein
MGHPISCPWGPPAGQEIREGLAGAGAGFDDEVARCVEFFGILPHSASLRVRMTAKTKNNH